MFFNNSIMGNQLIEYKVKRFDSLSKTELYNLLRLRSEVFVVEQNCVYQDIDNFDQQALHILGYHNKELCAYARVFNKGDNYQQYASIGRVLTSENVRGKGIAHQLLKLCISTIETEFACYEIKISAQKYLIKFYQTYGFKQVGDEYLEDGIPHVAMIREKAINC